MIIPPWIVRLITWDGIMPAVVCLSPRIVEFFFPNDEVTFATAFVLIVTFIFAIRFIIGRLTIEENHCDEAMKRLQTITFTMGMFVLMVIDTCVILSKHFKKKPGVPSFSVEGFIIWSCVCFMYLLLMAVSMYPGNPETGGNAQAGE